MTALEDWWAATSDLERDAARLLAWQQIDLPTTILGIEILSLTVAANVVEIYGSGTLIEWPLRLIDAPFGRPDENGLEIAPDGTTWTTDPLSVLGSVLGRLI